MKHEIEQTATQSDLALEEYSSTACQPAYRPRRMRTKESIRNALADVSLTRHNLVMPLFVKPGKGERSPVSSMPEVFQESPDKALQTVKEQADRGVEHFLLFGVVPPEMKDPLGTIAWSPENPVNIAMQMIRDAGLDVTLIADCCCCEYTDHGHCGALSKNPLETVDNDRTLELIQNQSLAFANYGADIIAPSGMMDGMIAAVRECLDSEGHSSVAIMSYAMKYASAMYGPFREAAQGAPKFGNRKAYQADYRRTREWKTEVELDIAEGADMLMVKPAHAYLDILRQVRDYSSLPVAAYHVSGEYSMICAAAANGWIDLKAAALEVTYAIRRAGADMIISYFTPRLLDWTQD